MLEITTYIDESDCTTDLEKQLYQVALDYQQLAEAYDKERKKKQADNYKCMPVAVNGLSEELQNAIFDINQIKDGINLFSGGGQAPANFARNLGQTSLGLSQFKLSAAPTWQQLANSMVVRPEAGLSAGLSAIGAGVQLASSAAGLGNQLAENQYQSATNQYLTQQAQNQQQAQFGMQLGQLGLQGYDALNKAKYYGGLSQNGQGYSNTLANAGFSNGLPSVFGGGTSNNLSYRPELIFK